MPRPPTTTLITAVRWARKPPSRSAPPAMRRNSVTESAIASTATTHHAVGSTQRTHCHRTSWTASGSERSGSLSQWTASGTAATAPAMSQEGPPGAPEAERDVGEAPPVAAQEHVAVPREPPRDEHGHGGDQDLRRRRVHLDHRRELHPEQRRAGRQADDPDRRHVREGAHQQPLPGPAPDPPVGLDADRGDLEEHPVQRQDEAAQRAREAREVRPVHLVDHERRRQRRARDGGAVQLVDLGPVGLVAGRRARRHDDAPPERGAAGALAELLQQRLRHRADGVARPRRRRRPAPRRGRCRPSVSARRDPRRGR